VRLWICDTNDKHLEDTSTTAQVDMVFKDYKKALERGPEFVWVCTPEHLHASMSIEALKRNAHVFCEKPLTDNLESGKRLVDEVGKSDKMFAVGYSCRYTKVFRTIKSLLEKNTIGTIVGGFAMVGAYETLTYAKTDHYLKQPWSLVLTYTHEIDYLRWFIGPVVKAAGFCGTLGDVEKKPDPNIVGCVLQFHNGAIVNLLIDYIQAPSERSLILIGDRGKVRFSTNNNEVMVYMYNMDSVVEPYEVIDVAEEDDEAYIREQECFFEHVEHGRPSEIVDVSDAYETLRVACTLIEGMESTGEAKNV